MLTTKYLQPKKDKGNSHLQYALNYPYLPYKYFNILSKFFHFLRSQEYLLFISLIQYIVTFVLSTKKFNSRNKDSSL